MPELPDITVYLEALARSVAGQRLARVQLRSLFVLRTSRPPIETLVGREVVELRRMGKRIVIGFGDDLWLVLHLMVAGRLQWLPREGRAKPPAGKIVLALFEFESGTLVLTEAGTKKRAPSPEILCSAMAKPEAASRGRATAVSSSNPASAERVAGVGKNMTKKRGGYWVVLAVVKNLPKRSDNPLVAI